MKLEKSEILAWKPPVIHASDARRASWVAFFAWVFAVYDFILFGTLLPEIGRHYNWDTAQQAAVATWVAVGTAIIAFLVGPIVDKLGRRTGILVTVVGAAVCSGLTAIGGAFGKLPLILIRSLAGLGYSEQTVNATYLNEMYTAVDDPNLTRRRGWYYSLVQGGWPIGALLAAGLTAVLLPQIGWRGCFIFATFPAIVIMFLVRRLKESPQFLVHRRIVALTEAGREADAGGLAREYGIDYEHHRQAGIGMAFSGRTLRSTIILGLSFMLNWFTIQVFSVLGTTVLTNVHKVSFENSLLILILSNIIGYVGYLTFGYIGDRIGRRNAIAVGWVLGGAAFAAVLFGPSDFTAVVTLYSVALFFLIGPYSAALFFISESFPTEIRATGGAIVAAMGPIGAILAGFGVTSILAGGGAWREAALYYGVLPCIASGILILGTRNVKPELEGEEVREAAAMRSHTS